MLHSDPETCGGHAVPAAEIIAKVGVLVSLLARREYRAVERLTKGVRLTAEDIESALLFLQSPEGEALSFSEADLDVVEACRSGSRRWSVSVPLCSGAGRRSDLTLSLTLIENGGTGEAMTVELDDIHVL
jgi:hypothetical protein